MFQHATTRVTTTKRLFLLRCRGHRRQRQRQETNLPILGYQHANKGKRGSIYEFPKLDECRRSFFCPTRLSLSPSKESDNNNGIDSYGPPLIELRNAQLAYPTRNTDDDGNASMISSPLAPIDLPIYPPDTLGNEKGGKQGKGGGYALLGRNGTGKSLIGHALVSVTKTTTTTATSSTSQTQRRQHEEEISEHSNPYLVKGSVLTGPKWHSQAIAHVSFASHQEVLERGGSCYRVIANAPPDHGTENLTESSSSTTTGVGNDLGGGLLTKAAQFLIVRFGLYALLSRDVRTLSTGEIRKTLLVRALAQRPKVLILDNAFDGLDVPSRAMLKDIVSRTIGGFTQDILVQGVSSKATAHTQIVLMTHRAEEIVDAVESISFIENDSGKVLTEERNGRTGLELLQVALNSADSGGGNGNATTENEPATSLEVFDWQSPSLPSVEEVVAWWNYGRENEGLHHKPPRLPTDSESNNSRVDNKVIESDDDDILVEANKLTIHLAEDDVTLLYDLDWTIRNGERWLIGGRNGSGKSTLSRLLATSYPYVNQTKEESDENHYDSDNSIDDDDDDDGNDSALRMSLPYGIGWVSTESHLALAKSDILVEDLLFGSETKFNNKWLDDNGFGDGGADGDGKQDADALESRKKVALQVARWLDIDGTTRTQTASHDQYTSSSSSSSSWLKRQFSQLSQGEQKLVLIAAALAKRPSLLVLDEPCQGLDLIHRQRVLTLIERICSATSTIIPATKHNDNSINRSNNNKHDSSQHHHHHHHHHHQHDGLSLVYITHHFEELLPCVTHALHLQDRQAVYCGPIEDYQPENYDLM